MIHGKKGRKLRDSREAGDGYGTHRLQVKYHSREGQDLKESSAHSGTRVLMSDSLSTHLDQKTVVARFDKVGG